MSNRQTCQSQYVNVFELLTIPLLEQSKEWDNIINIKLAFSIISLVVDCYTFLTLLTLVEKRQFPANLAIAATGIHMIWMVAFVISGGIGQVDLKD